MYDEILKAKILNNQLEYIITKDSVTFNYIAEDDILIRVKGENRADGNVIEEYYNEILRYIKDPIFFHTQISTKKYFMKVGDYEAHSPNLPYNAKEDLLTSYIGIMPLMDPQVAEKASTILRIIRWKIKSYNKSIENFRNLSNYGGQDAYSTPLKKEINNDCKNIKTISDLLKKILDYSVESSVTKGGAKVESDVFKIEKCGKAMGKAKLLFTYFWEKVLTHDQRVDLLKTTDILNFIKIMTNMGAELTDRTKYFLEYKKYAPDITTAPPYFCTNIACNGLNAFIKQYEQNIYPQYQEIMDQPIKSIFEVDKKEMQEIKYSHSDIITLRMLELEIEQQRMDIEKFIEYQLMDRVYKPHSNKSSIQEIDGEDFIYTINNDKDRELSIDDIDIIKQFKQRVEKFIKDTIDASFYKKTLQYSEFCKELIYNRNSNVKDIEEITKKSEEMDTITKFYYEIKSLKNSVSIKSLYNSALKYEEFLNKAMECNDINLKVFKEKFEEINIIRDIHRSLVDLKKSAVGTLLHKNILQYEEFFNEALKDGAIKTKEFKEKFRKLIDNDLSIANNINDDLLTKVSSIGLNMLCSFCSCKRRKTKKEIIQYQLKELKKQFEK